MKQANELHLAFIGAGVMAESMIAGLLRREAVDAKNITVSHPRESRRAELTARYGITAFEHNAEAATAIAGKENSSVLICVKPQRLDRVLGDFSGVLNPDQLVVSIVGGARIGTLADALGTAKIVRAMPNTPSQIGAGITAWTCSEAVRDPERELVRHILAPLGKELFVE